MASKFLRRLPVFLGLFFEEGFGGGFLFCHGWEGGVLTLASALFAAALGLWVGFSPQIGSDALM